MKNSNERDMLEEIEYYELIQEYELASELRKKYEKNKEKVELPIFPHTA